jgi:fumarate hydratase subunit beta
MYLPITSPLDTETIQKLRAGDRVMISGFIYTARDAAHKRLIAALKGGERLPFDLEGQVLYYVGQSPPRPGKIVGSMGPTTSARMDVYTPQLIEAGLKGMIGKGPRSQEVKEALRRYKAVYFAAVGGVGALISRIVQKSELVAYEDLGAEAIYWLEIRDFPLIVVNDIYGNDFYREERTRILSKIGTQNRL